MSEIRTLVPYYGGNRRLSRNVGLRLSGCRWVGVPFAGGMPELWHLDAQTIVVNDLSRQVINLAAALKDDVAGPRLIRELRREIFHPDALAAAQADASLPLPDDVARSPDVNVAKAYFVTQWMSRSGCSGTRGELRGSLAVRWDAGGGDSAKRYRSATAALLAFRRIAQRCTFQVQDALEFIEQIKDLPDVGVYCDPPFFGPVGARYAHSLTLEQHERLAQLLARFQQAHVVCRFYDCDEVRRLYPAGQWIHERLDGGKDSHNQDKPELLLSLARIPF